MLTVSLIFIILGILLYRQMRLQQKESLKKGYWEKLEQYSYTLDKGISESERILHYISRNPVVQKVLQDKYDTFLEANNEVNDNVETYFWYLTTSRNSMVDELSIYSFKRGVSAGHFIFGLGEVSKEDWYERLVKDKERFFIADGGELILIYPVYQVNSFKLIGAIKAKLDIQKLTEFIKISSLNSGCQLRLGEEVLIQKGGCLSDLKIEKLSDISGMELVYFIEPIPVFEGTLMMLGLVFLSTVAVIGFFLIYNSTINKNHQEIIAAQKKEEYLHSLVLKAQISPHFLYNVMSMINWKAKYSGQEDIGRICRELSDFYRTALNKGQEEITIHEELLNIESYLKLKQHLVEIPFSYEIDVPEELKNIKIINFILQPIVENAIIHGIGELEGGGHIRITVEEEDDIFITVEDNGGKIVSRSDFFGNEKGYGIHNVDARIRFKYGENYGIFPERISNMTRVIVKVGKNIQKKC